MIEILTKFDAVLSLVGGGLSQPLDGIIRYHSGQTPPTEAEIDTEVIRLQAEYDAQEYARERATAYPSVGEQLDEIYHNGIASWKAVIKVTKDKYPKG
tara:strand:- start:74 stop:367 length:294 start_codon:yes stop_codon:yes gene_type:complete